MPAAARPGRAGFPHPLPASAGLIPCQLLPAGRQSTRARTHARGWHGMAWQACLPRARAYARGRQAGRQPGPARPAPTFAPGGVQARPRGWCRPRPCQWPWQACRTSPPAGRAWAGLLCFLSFLSEKPWAGQGQAGGACGGGYFSAGVTAGKLRGDLFRVAGSYGRYTIRCNGASWGPAAMPDVLAS